MVMILLSLSAFGDARKAAQEAVVELSEAYLGQASPGAFRKAVAILPIEVPETLRRSGAVDAVEAYIREKFSLSTVFVLVERENMEALLAEIELGLSGLVDADSAAQAGELLGAEFFVQGSLSEAGPSLVLSMEQVEASTARIISSVTRSIPRDELLASGADFLRSSFQSQYGISVYARGGTAATLASYYIPDFSSDPSTYSPGSLSLGVWDLGVSYKPLRWLGLEAGILGLSAPQFYFSEDGKVLSTLSPGLQRTIRYSMFDGFGPSFGLSGIFSLGPRINLGLLARGFLLVDHALTHWFMDFYCYDIDDAGGITPVKRYIEMEAMTNAVPIGATASLRAEYLVSRRMSLGVDAGFLWMPPYQPDMFQTGNLMQLGNYTGGFDNPYDYNGTFDFMGGFNVARVDGSTGSDFIIFDPTGLVVTAYIAVHF